MALYPNNRRDAFAFLPLRQTGYLSIAETGPRSASRINNFTALKRSSSFPEGSAPAASIWMPIVAGAMVARSTASIATAANALNGGPMQAPATMAMTMADPSMSLTVGMSAPWTGTYTPSASLRLTIGMEATFTAVFNGSSNLAMIVPLGSTTFAAAFVGVADLKGRLSMAAEFGGPTPLAQEVAATVLAAAQAAPIHANVQRMNDAEVIGTGTTGDAWRGVGVAP